MINLLKSLLMINLLKSLAILSQNVLPFCPFPVMGSVETNTPLLVRFMLSLSEKFFSFAVLVTAAFLLLVSGMLLLLVLLDMLFWLLSSLIDNRCFCSHRLAVGQPHLRQYNLQNDKNGRANHSFCHHPLVNHIFTDSTMKD